MSTNILYCCVSRLRDISASPHIAYGHAMLFVALPAKAFGSGGSSICMLAPITIDAQGSSVPISRGGPPIFNE